MPKGPTKRRPQTNSRLLDAALEVFAERGFGGASVSEICKRAGYTTGALYSNYASKEELFLALFERHSRALAGRVAAAAEVATGSPEPLMALAAFMSTPDDDAREWFLISTEFTLHAIRNPEFAGALAERDAQARADLIGIIRPLLGATAAPEVADLDGLLRLVTALREGGLAQSLVEPDALAHGELERRYLPSILRDLGLTTRSQN